MDRPETAWFSGMFNDLEPAYSPDGNKLFFYFQPTRRSRTTIKMIMISGIFKKPAGIGIGLL